MRVGKLTPAQLAGLVYPHLGVRRPEVLVHSGIGEDSTVIDFGDSVAVLSTDPITGAAKNMGWLGVHVACNDIAAMGAEPVGVLVTLLLTESTSCDQAAQIMRDVHRAAAELGIEVLGGHSEVTPGLPNAIISLTSVGRAPRSRFVTSSGGRPGDALVVTKAAGLEGTAILATDREEWLVPRVGAEVVRRAQAFVGEISVVPEGLIAAAAGATAMHDATEGGVLGAIYELAEASKRGVEVLADRIPVRPETRAICAGFGIDPLRLVSSGTLVVAAPDGDTVVTRLAEAGISAAVVGRLTDGDRAVTRDGVRRELAPPESDELWTALGASLG